MKKVFRFFVAAAIALPLALSSCSKEDPAEPLEVDLTKSGTFKVTLLAVTNTFASPQVYAAAPITKDNIVATVPYNTLNSSASGNYLIPKGNIDYNTSTGVLEVKNVPTVENGITLTVKIIPVLGTRTEPSSTGTESVSVAGIWSYSYSITENILPGASAQQTFKVVNFAPDKAVGSKP